MISAQRAAAPDSRQALATLCETYWYPLYAYARRRTRDVHEARDWTQAFFARLLEKEYLSTAVPERGRFRAFLLTAFKHFLANEWDKAKAQKRGGGQTVLSLDFPSADSKLHMEPEAGLTPEQVYAREWAIALLQKITDRLQAEFGRMGKSDQFEALKGFLIGGEAGQTYAQVAARLNMTEAAARKAGSRMRERYRELLRVEIADTVEGPEEVEDEIRNLFAVFQT